MQLFCYPLYEMVILQMLHVAAGLLSLSNLTHFMGINRFTGIVGLVL